jgi:hypothetical protein
MKSLERVITSGARAHHHYHHHPNHHHAHHHHHHHPNHHPNHHLHHHHHDHRRSKHTVVHPISILHLLFSGFCLDFIRLRVSSRPFGFSGGESVREAPRNTRGLSRK